MFIIGSHETIIGYTKNLTILDANYEYFPSPKFNDDFFILKSSSYSNLTTGTAPPSI